MKIQVCYEVYHMNQFLNCHHENNLRFAVIQDFSPNSEIELFIQDSN